MKLRSRGTAICLQIIKPMPDDEADKPREMFNEPAEKRLNKLLVEMDGRELAVDRWPET